MNLILIQNDIWHDFDHDIDLIFSPDDKGYYFTHNNGKASQVFNTKAKAEQEFEDGLIKWD